MTRRAKIVGLAAAMVVIGVAGLTWSDVKIRTAGAPAKPAPASSDVAATGRIEARREAAVRSKGQGRVRRLLAREGAWVRAGAPVVLLDDTMEEAARREAQAEVSLALSRLKRVRPLHEKGFASDQELDEADGAFRLARARQDKAWAALEERRVRAPFSGRILKTYFEEGESLPAAPGDSLLFVIGDTSGLRVRAEIDELDVGRVAPGAPARVAPDALPGEVFEGIVAEVSGMLGRKSLRSEDPRERLDARVLEISIALPPSERLKPGLSVQVKLTPAARGGGS